jgi:hypothetical protein
MQLYCGKQKEAGENFGVKVFLERQERRMIRRREVNIKTDL